MSVLSTQLLVGDAGDVLKTLPENCVDTLVTSPPYYRQRDYGDGRQLGLEESPEAYVSRLLAVFDEVKRVLKPTGSIWLNLGDKYMDGSLLGLPWRVALALCDRGWVMRSDIIWHKPNAMPHSVKTRPTHDHEYIFFMTRTSDYYYDADAIREPHVTFSDKSKMRGGRGHFGKRNGTPEAGKNAGSSNLHDARWDQAFHPKGRNKRTVWSVPLSKFRGAHFAVFPTKLIEPCVLAGSPEGGVVMDPFMGSGTVGRVALRHNRRFIGIDLNPEYVTMAEKRIGSVQQELSL